MVFCNGDILDSKMLSDIVTILILIDGFLQSKEEYGLYEPIKCHNPYFNRWFSAIMFKNQSETPMVLSQSLF